MRLAIGLLALALTGAEAPAPPNTTQIGYELRFVEMSGVAWRGELHAKLQPVTRQGGITVWTASKDGVEALQKAVMASPKGSIVACPKVTAFAGAVAHVSQKSARNLVVDAERGGDGPVDHATKVSYEPKLEKIREGTAATIRGRKLDQGILAQIALEDTRIAGVHNVALSESLEGEGNAAGSKAVVQIQLPEVAHREVAGEWLIPNDGVLVVSFGVVTVAEADGKAGVRERLALISAKAGEGPEAASTPTRAMWVPASPSSVDVNRTGFAHVGGPGAIVSFAPVLPSSGIPMPAPRVPSRTLPEPVNQDGAPAPLPPLPEDHAPPTALPYSSEPCATPQTRGHHPILSEPVPEGPSQSFLEGDVSVTRTSAAVPDACDVDAKSFVVHAAPAPPVIPVQAARAVRWQLLNGAVTIDIKTIRRTSESAPRTPAHCEITPADAAPVHPR